MLSKIGARLLMTAGVLGVMAVIPAHANIFGKDKQPVPQWGLDAAKTATPAYAKDSPAVILYDEYVETIDNNGRAVEREHEAIRILKPQGRSFAQCGVAFDVDEKINYFRAWTLSADGKEFQAQDTDFSEVGDTSASVMLSTRKMRVVHPPAADVGATVICETEELLPPWMRETYWEIEHAIPAVFQAMELDLPSGRSYAASWHHFPESKPTEVASNHIRWEVKDVHALELRDIPSHPSFGALAGRVALRWEYVDSSTKDAQWTMLGKWWTNIETHRTDPTPEITAQTEQLIAGAPDFYTKLQRITEYIQKNVRYFIVERGIGGFQSHPAGDIFRNKYGDCKDKTTILISMLQTAGIQSNYLLVDVRRGVVDPDSPSLYGNHMITAIEVPADVKDPRLQAIATAKNGKRYLIFDPTNEHTAVGNLPSYEQGSYGILSAGDESQLLALPILKPDANTNTSTGTFTLAADGTLVGTVDSSHDGPDGADYRWIIKYTNDKERHEYWETKLAEDVPGVVLEQFNFVQPTTLSKPLELHYKISAKQYAHQTGPLLLVRPRVVDSYASYFDDKPRTVPIDLSATGHWHESFDITLPQGYVVDETPDPVDVDTDFVSYHSKISAQGDKLHYERDYQVKKVELPANKSFEFRKAESAILRDEKGTAVLKKQ
jgi:transglutaminase-like putative cysteine protease